jgi:3-deoxy-manno-octulosonate cytidylyltransferase (CMP-KDO synthetase)
MSFIVLIPARLTSTRLPNKPLADIGGIPMVVRVARQAMKSDATQTVVAADSAAIVEVCAEFGVRAILTRADHVSGSDRLAEACDLLSLCGDDVVVNVQGDEPLINPLLINATAQTLLNHTECSMSTAAHAIANLAEFLNPNVVKVITDARQKALYFSRSPIPACRDGDHTAWWKSRGDMAAPLRHIGIYGYRVSFLQHFLSLPPAPIELLESLEQLRALWHGFSIAVHITPDTPGPGVDTPEDLERVRQLTDRSLERHANG